MKAALVQLTTGRDMTRNVERVCDLVRSAAAEGADFVTTPETSHLMELDRERVLAVSFEEAKDPGIAAFTALARTLGIWLHIGSLILRRPDGRLANRSVLIAPDGRIRARYDKIHMFDVVLKDGESYRESALYEAGNQAVVAQADSVAFGLSICYDLRFAALYRALAEAGAAVLLVPAAFTRRTGEAHWHTLLRARAIETGSFVLAAAQSGRHETGRETYGHSLAISPWGDVLVDGGDGEGVHTVTLDLDEVAHVRRSIPVLESGRKFDINTVTL